MDWWLRQFWSKRLEEYFSSLASVSSRLPAESSVWEIWSFISALQQSIIKWEEGVTTTEQPKKHYLSQVMDEGQQQTAKNHGWYYVPLICNESVILPLWPSAHNPYPCLTMRGRSHISQERGNLQYTDLYSSKLKITKNKECNSWGCDILMQYRLWRSAWNRERTLG